MKDLPKLLFFLILITYPFFSYILYKGTGMKSNYVFGFLCFLFLLNRTYLIFKDCVNFRLPFYLIVFGIFTTYTIVSSIFITDQLIDEGPIKYFYSNSFFLTFMAFLIVENTSFSEKWIMWAIKFLAITIIISGLVSVIQIYKPLFLVKNDMIIDGLSFDRFSNYYSSDPLADSGSVDRLIDGYRLSIYSYISDISVGLDSIAIFSLLLALKSTSWMKAAILVVAAALVSFLSSARWIMLNFLVVASQYFWISKNKLANIFKVGIYGLIIVIFLLPLTKFSDFNIQQFSQERLLSKSAYTRILAIEIFSKVYPDNPIFGTGGVDTPKMLRLIAGRTSQIHVGYLKLFYYYGLIGGLIYLTFLGSLLLRMWKIAHESKYWGGFFAILAFAIANLTLVELNLFYYGLILALIFSNHYYFQNLKKSSISDDLSGSYNTISDGEQP